MDIESSKSVFCWVLGVEMWKRTPSKSTNCTSSEEGLQMRVR